MFTFDLLVDQMQILLEESRNHSPEDFVSYVDQFFAFRIFTEYTRHVLFQLTHDQCMDLRRTTKSNESNECRSNYFG